jgi:ribosomal protein S18 acetylase RimI-like enzyme
MEIRPATTQDEDALYYVALVTGDAGADGTHLFDDPRLVGEVFVGPYIHLEPDFAYSVQDAGTVGYLLGCLDTRTLEQRCAQSWWPRLQNAYPLDVSRRTTDQELVQYIHNPQPRPEGLVNEFPSHLHIDLVPRAQGHGYGPVLLQFMLDRLREVGSRGVHLGVALNNLRAQKVYRSLGFQDWERNDDELVMAVALT